MPKFEPHQLKDKARYIAFDDEPTPPDVDVQKMRRYRQSRIREQMRRYDYDACILFDAVNIRYASGARNMQVFTSRNPPPAIYLCRQKVMWCCLNFPAVLIWHKALVLMKCVRRQRYPMSPPPIG